MRSMSREVRRLGLWEEGVSVLNDLEVKDGVLYAGFNKFVLALPIEMEGMMRPHVGKRIGVLRTDIQGKQYLIRVIPDRENNKGGP